MDYQEETCYFTNSKVTDKLLVRKPKSLLTYQIILITGYLRYQESNVITLPQSYVRKVTSILPKNQLIVFSFYYKQIHSLVSLVT